MTAHLISKRVTALPAPFVETAAGIHMVNPKLQQTSHRKPEFLPCTRTASAARASQLTASRFSGKMALERSKNIFSEIFRNHCQPVRAVRIP